MAIYHSTLRALGALLTSESGVAVKGLVADGTTCSSIALTTWETSRLPDMHAKTLAPFDAVIVPSQFCADRVRSHRGNVFVVPHCFDEGFWPMPERRQASGSYRFLAIGAWGERKNLLGVIKAYLAAFSRDDDVELLVLCDRPDFDQIRATAATSGRAPHQLPALHVPDRGGTLSEAELVELHAASDCFVSATRGEGWGLGLFEAAIMGKKVIATDWSGHKDFLDLIDGHFPRDVAAQAFLIPYHLTPCWGAMRSTEAVDTYGQGMQRAIVDLPYGVDCTQRWADPDLSALADVMQMVYETRDNQNHTSLDRVRSDRAFLESKFGYRTVGQQIAQTISEILTTCRIRYRHSAT